MGLCGNFVVEKIRFEDHFEGHIFEVDEFLEENKGSIVAEVEPQHEDETFKKT